MFATWNFTVDSLMCSSSAIDAVALTLREAFEDFELAGAERGQRVRRDRLGLGGLVRVQGDPRGQPPAGDGVEIQVVLVQAEALGQLAQVQHVLEPAGAVVADSGLEIRPGPPPADADPPYVFLGEHREDHGPDGDAGAVGDPGRDQPIVAGGIQFEVDRPVPEQGAERVGESLERLAGRFLAAPHPVPLGVGAQVGQAVQGELHGRRAGRISVDPLVPQYAEKRGERGRVGLTELGGEVGAGLGHGPVLRQGAGLALEGQLVHVRGDQVPQRLKRGGGVRRRLVGPDEDDH